MSRFGVVRRGGQRCRIPGWHILTGLVSAEVDAGVVVLDGVLVLVGGGDLLVSRAGW
ncbi:Uncharacterized protein FKW44_000408 [Caligus rogercresseyi]|uniref:Uncharacterized protein n=1 Tax=Caligus rogercresseyi TaxID=217165 RepID=A0A7T8KHD8_CALRO|nr:Uncharacterized protein FKW44_000408 [Caligus rogercresseyi]